MRTMAMDCPACGTGSSINSIPSVFSVCVCPHCDTKIIVKKVEIADDGLYVEAEIFHGEIDPDYWKRRK